MQDPASPALLPRPTTYIFSAGHNMSRTVGSRDSSGHGSSPPAGNSAQALAASEDRTLLPPLRPTLSSSPSSASSCSVDDDRPLSPGGDQAALLASNTRRKRSRSWSNSSSPTSTGSKTANHNRPRRRPAIGTTNSGDSCYRGCGGPIRGEEGGDGPTRGHNGQDLQRLGGDQVGDGGCSPVTEETPLDAHKGREEGSGGSPGSDALSPGPAVETNGPGVGSSSLPDGGEEGTASADKPSSRVLVSDGQRADRHRTSGARGKGAGAGTARGETIKGESWCAGGEGDGEEGVEVLSEDFGLFTWPSGVVLACLIWARRREFDGASVVEIGAGTALPGLLAAKLGASVVLTDREEAPWVLDNMRGAVAANGLNLGPPDDASPAIGTATAETVSAETVCAAVPAIADGGGGPSTGAAPAPASGAAMGGCVKEWQSKDKRMGAWEPDGRGTGGYSSLAPSVAATAAAGAESFPRDQEKGTTREGRVGGTTRLGRCSVQGLSWGSVGAAAIKLARERRPQVVLGADVFYSSEHFNDVLATAFMLLSGSSSTTPAAGGGGCASGDCDGATTPPPSGVAEISSAATDAPAFSAACSAADDVVVIEHRNSTNTPPPSVAAGINSAATDASSSSMTPAAGGGGGVIGDVDDTATAPLASTTGTSSAVTDAPSSSMTCTDGVGDCANGDVDDTTTAPLPNSATGTSSAAAPTAPETTPRGPDTAGSGPASLAGAVGSEWQRTSSAKQADSTPTFGSPFSRSRGVFLTAYQERSARRSIRPLLRKWGMQARVLHDVPQRVLPPALWESGRYDSVALLEITLT
ncbi:unnamed protein product [Ectocarpus sp. CCAP 1310/34]|nr:unnamed protein product [Ectocarpus sp. CCAP 1310/34]